MNVNRRSREDVVVSKIKKILQTYKKKHPHAVIDAYRSNAASVRVRIIDNDFSGLDRVERDNKVWSILEELPEEVQSEISMVVLITPEERSTSMGNMVFDEAIGSTAAAELTDDPQERSATHR